MNLFFSLLISNVVGISESLNEYNNQLTQNYVTISIKDEMSQEERVEFIRKVEGIPNIIIKLFKMEKFDTDGDKIAFYFNNKYNMGYKLMEGRFFRPEDFQNKDKLAVIGKNMKKNIYIENGKKYVLRGMEKFTVIGIIGNVNRSSKYDDTVLYNLNASLYSGESLAMITLYIDSASLSRKEIKDEIYSINKEKILINDGIKQPNPIGLAIKFTKGITINLSLIVICVLLTFGQSVIYWIKGTKIEIGLRKLCGATNKSLLKSLLLRFFAASTIAFILALFVQTILVYILQQVNNNRVINKNYFAAISGIFDLHVSISNILLVAVLSLFLGAIFLVLIFREINKIEVNQLLKEL